METLAGTKTGTTKCAGVEGGPESIEVPFSSRTHECNRQHPKDKLEPHDANALGFSVACSSVFR
jgi:hypothetical protein